ncbi:diguanylate cyclase [Devosia sp. FJ2-5-3]|jgi:diguanylate cyclase (GGDEF)-like protein|uniref:diguanylate cyclase domain-containing protein n=1 Tax=Devosia sp. FJ2-5-3 TaxID=2976680 RepID=UPI0023D85889|nr:diguanylate cyclase [Devosia sp. FJ2-5-3]WEJ57595.1 GGDEF domain-containing protein [Devosia sp. FJ2-5-3]
MSMMDLSQSDSLWARIRALLQLTPAGRAYAGIGLRSGQNRPLDEEMRRCWALAAERHVSLCVMTLEIDCFAEYLAAYGRDASEDCMDALEGAIRSIVGAEEARCLRMGQAGFVLILPDLPVLMARSLAGKIMKAVRLEGLVNKESHAGIVTLGCGIAVVNPQGAFEPNVIEAAMATLRRAQRHGLSRIETADLRGGEIRTARAA